jgi:hypothetical protein
MKSYSEITALSDGAKDALLAIAKGQWSYCDEGFSVRTDVCRDG